MKDDPKTFIFITGNQHKADYLAKWLEMPVDHRKIDLDEIQSLNLRVIVEHKVRQAYDIVKQPVLVEDVGFTFEALGRLPGPLIKWFLEELGDTGLCRLADGLEHRKAHVSIIYALFDGTDIHYFENHVQGAVAPEPRGEYGFGWNAIFIPDGLDKTYAEMTDDEVRPFSVRAQAIEKIKDFLQQA
jgi:non-canonical purine NTP pyrophosphatase (RdgB/HAM1 family)